IWSVRPDGSNLKQLTAGPFDDREPQYSHEGTRVAFSSDRNGNYDIWVMDLKTGRVTPRTNQPSNESMPAWSPDDKEIAYYTDRPNAHAIMAVGASGAERVVQAINGAANAPSWSPDGKQILYNLFADNQSRLALSGNGITSGEDVFPFRAQWISADEFIYTADGKIKRRSLENHSVRNIDFTASVSLPRQTYKQNHRDFDSTAARPVAELSARCSLQMGSALHLSRSGISGLCQSEARRSGSRTTPSLNSILRGLRTGAHLHTLQIERALW